MIPDYDYFFVFIIIVVIYYCYYKIVTLAYPTFLYLFLIDDWIRANMPPLDGA